MDPIVTNLRSTVTQFALILLVPVDVDGKRVKLDADAIAAEALRSGEGARTHVKVIDEPDGNRSFEVALIPGDAPGESEFSLRGDGQPGEGVVILEERYIYTTTPNNAVGLGATVKYLSKAEAPA